MNSIKEMWKHRPLTLILWVALIFRLVAAVFSKGFGMHDDHFLIIEASKSWVDGYDYNHWLPWSPGNVGPEGHSFFYVGIHFIIFTIFKAIHINDPQTQMLIIRFMHAFWSLLIISISFKITKRISTERNAKFVGIFLATYFILPFLSVRNLVEVVCIPFLLAGTHIVIRKENEEKNFWPLVWAGFLLGLAFSVRFQTIIFTGGLGLALLFRKHVKEMFSVALGTLISIVLIQGGIDLFIWGKPFMELGEYIRYNLTHANDYNVVPWYTYILLLAGILIPPVSLFLMFGFLKTFKKYFLLFFPTFLFLFFHSYFPNKQERFILPALPFIIILGTIGWNNFVEGSRFWANRQKLLKCCWVFFWTINLILLPITSVVYSKKARVESMTYLAAYPKIPALLFENTNEYGTKMPPMFYLQQWTQYQSVSKSNTIQHYKEELKDNKNLHTPGFVIFEGDKNLNQRVDSVKTVLPHIVPDAVIHPGFMDEFLYWLNPVNANQTLYIYRNTDVYPKTHSEYEKR